jgi:hypothetical protein
MAQAFFESPLEAILAESRGRQRRLGITTSQQGGLDGAPARKKARSDRGLAVSTAYQLGMEFVLVSAEVTIKVFLDLLTRGFLVRFGLPGKARRWRLADGVDLCLDFAEREAVFVKAATAAYDADDERMGMDPLAKAPAKLPLAKVPLARVGVETVHLVCDHIQAGLADHAET